jgi:hypothetical protein
MKLSPCPKSAPAHPGRPHILPHDTAADTLAPLLFGFLVLGVAIMLGVFMNLAAASGAALLLMWSAVLPPETTR